MKHPFPSLGRLLSAAGFFAAMLLFAIFLPPLVRTLGAEGAAYFFPALGTWLFVFLTAGVVFPAVSARAVRTRAALEDYGGCRVIFTDSLLALVIPGAVLSALLALLSNVLGNWFGLPESGDALLGIAPTFLLGFACAAFRGYHLALEKQGTYGLSLALSAGAGIVLALALGSAGATAAAKAQLAALGLSIGALLSLVFLGVMFLRVRREVERITPENTPELPPMKVTARFVWLTGGLSALALAAVSLFGRIDALVLPGRLAVQGYTQHDVRAIFAAFGGASVIAAFGALLAAALSLGSIQSVSHAMRRRDADSLRTEVGFALKKVLLLALPFTAVALVLAKPFAALLFGSALTEAELASAAMLAGWAAPCLLLLSVALATAALLSSMRKAAVALVNLLLAAVAKLLLGLLLTGEGRNVVGGLYCSILALLLLCAFNTAQLLHRSGAPLDPINTLAKPAGAAVCMGAALYFLYALFESFLGAVFGAILSLLLGALIYCALILVLRVLSRDELLRLPFGGAIYRFLASSGLYR